MIIEIADFKIDPAQHDAFGQALTEAVQTVLSQAAGYQGHTILAGIESPGRYVLQVQWDTLQDHMVGFRESAAFVRWRAIIGPYFAAPPHVEHFSLVAPAKAA